MEPPLRTEPAVRGRPEKVAERLISFFFLASNGFSSN